MSSPNTAVDEVVEKLLNPDLQDPQQPATMQKFGIVLGEKMRGKDTSPTGFVSAAAVLILHGRRGYDGNIQPVEYGLKDESSTRINALINMLPRLARSVATHEYEDAVKDSIDKAYAAVQKQS